MKILFTIVPGCLPNLVHDPGKWWDSVSASKEHECVYFNANEVWWREFCSKAFVGVMAEKLPLAGIISKKLSASVGITGLEKLASRAGGSLEAMRAVETYASVESYVSALKPFSDYMRVFNFLSEEFSVGIQNGPVVKDLGYRETSEMLAFSRKNTILRASYRKAAERIPFRPEACFIPVTSEYDMLSAMIWTQCLKEMFPGIYVCVTDPGYENFSLDWQAESIIKTGAVFESISSIIKHSYEADRVLPLLVRDLAAGRRPSGFLRREDFAGEAPVPSGEASPPLMRVFSPEPSFLLRLSSKGCYWNKCAFCAQHSKHDSGAAPEKVDIDAVFPRIERLAQVGYKYFYFEDEAVHPDLLGRFCDLVLSKKLDIKWGCRCRLDARHPDALLRKMKKAGCREVFFGVETVVPRVQLLMRKYAVPVPAETTRAVINATAEAGLGQHLTFITGFPGETPEEARVTADFIAQTLKDIPRVTYHIGRLNLLPQAETYRNAGNYGIIPEAFKGDLNCYCRFSFSAAGAEEANRRSEENLPQLQRDLDAALGWDEYEKTPERRLVRELYFNYAIRVFVKSQEHDIFTGSERLSE